MLRCRSRNTAGGFRWVWKKSLRSQSTIAMKSPEPPRINPVGIQYLSSGLDAQVFPHKRQITATDQERLTEISKNYLSHHGLLGKKTAITEPLDFKIPPLEGDTLDEHFRRLALYATEPYLNHALDLARSQLLPMPKKFAFRSGWLRYTEGEAEPVAVKYPDDDALVFDVETQYKVSKYAVMAVAASKKAWYVWISPKLTGESDSYDHLIPLNTVNQEKVIVGHNVGYDRARVKEEYDLKETKAFYLDTMALHIAVSGMCTRQRIKWMEHRKLKNDVETTDDQLQDFETDDPWVKSSSPNSLADVAQFYIKQEVKKDIRDVFATDDIDVIRTEFEDLIQYCANDVLVTHKVYSAVLPEFLKQSPHPVSFAALRFMGAGILTTNSQWDEYIERAERLYQESRQKIEQSLQKLAEEAVELRTHPEKAMQDPWLSQLDWTIAEPKYTKSGQPYKNQRLPGYPEWYRELYNTKTGALDITIRTRITPILLKLKWEDYPVVWHDMFGWCFKAPSDHYQELKAKNYILVPTFEETLGKKLMTKREIEKAEKEGRLDEIREHEELLKLTEEAKNMDAFFGVNSEFVYFRIPNSIGPLHRTTLLLAKPFTVPFEKGILNSDNPITKEALRINASCSYWISSRERIMNQFVVKKNSALSIILPQVVTMGTVTRRAVEKTWLTASNAKSSRIGSELKSKIIAPKGYCFVGADVDSEELWIASLVGDAMFKLHGGTAIGWMTLEGAKSEGTDLHSKTANILGISRNEAKIFNYGRIYGAGVKFATTLLKKFNPNLTDEECSERAQQLYAETKGQSGYYNVGGKSMKLWFGGSESVLFNELERIALQEHPRTPVLGASITKALMKKNLNANSFLPSRVNWAIQSSGVDYLHLLCVSMNYLIKKYSIKARLSLSVHDEIRYLVKEEDKYRAAMALQISNIWTRAIFSENLGMSDLPQSCAFFSAVDVDHILRKEVDMDCVTPSNPDPVEPGESLDIKQLLAKPDSSLGRAARLSLKKKYPTLDGCDFESESALEVADENPKFSLDNPQWKETYLKMQTATTIDEFRSLFKQYKKGKRVTRAPPPIMDTLDDRHMDVIRQAAIQPLPVDDKPKKPVSKTAYNDELKAIADSIPLDALESLGGKKVKKPVKKVFKKTIKATTVKNDVRKVEKKDVTKVKKEAATAPKKRGRPKKEAQGTEKKEATTAPKKRGRPKKVVQDFDDSEYYELFGCSPSQVKDLQDLWHETSLQVPGGPILLDAEKPSRSPTLKSQDKKVSSFFMGQNITPPKTRPSKSSWTFDI